MNSRGNRAGFTLLEVVLVVGLLGVVSALAVTAFVNMSDYWRLSLREVEWSSRADQAIEAVRVDLASLLSPALSGASFRGLKGAEGAPDSQLVLAVHAPTGGTGPTGSGLVRYALDTRAETPALIRYQGPLGGEQPTGQAVSVAEGIVRFHLEYLDAAGKWVESWDAPGPPRAVRVSVVAGDGLAAVSRSAVLRVPVTG